MSSGDIFSPIRPELLAAHDLCFSYAPGVPVVREASLAVPRGFLSALIGPNGSGKSTLLRLLAGILVPSSGHVSFEGQPLAAIERRHLATRIAYVPQTQSTVFPFTALEVVLTGRSPYTSRFRFENEQDRFMAMAALQTVDAVHLAGRPVTELSGGERQLVAVARALAQKVDCLLLDEPSSSLDLKHRARLIGVLHRLREERALTLLLVTHDLQLLDPSFDHLFAMREGRVISQGSPSEVLREEILTRIYDDARVCARRVDGRTFVWSEG